MDNPCIVCAANGTCPYFGLADGYSAQCDDILARLVEGSRESYRKAWDSYTREDKNIDINDILFGILD